MRNLSYRDENFKATEIEDVGALWVKSSGWEDEMLKS
jgi:hypothetical protein